MVWCVGLVTTVTLGYLRTATDAEFVFASAAIIPVVAIAWFCGREEGLALSLIAALMWTITDLMTDRHFSAAWIPYVNGLTRFAIYGFVVHLTAKVKTLLDREREIARHDALTGILNRRAFFESGKAELNRSRRYSHPIAVAFLDLDNFKQLNDSQGHEAGDSALKAVAAALSVSLRTTDRVARLGGDEFAVLLPEISYEAAKETGIKIAAAADVALVKFPPVSISIGIAWFESTVDNFQEMLEAADSLMYEIKQEGKHGMRTKRFAPPCALRTPGEAT
jgi:diguanylate cyclase (GGDEF)-like protein